MEKRAPYGEHNQTETPLKVYRERLAAADPEEIANRLSLPLSGSSLTVTVMGEDRTVTLPDFTDEGWSDYDRILISNWLLSAHPQPFGGSYLTYREMPWGEVYDKPFHGRCIYRLAGTYGKRPEAFQKACSACGGTPLPGNGLRYLIPFMKDLSLQFILWEGDEDFPASAQILFSDNFPASFAAEDRVVVAEYVLRKMKNAL